ncbi:MAG: hypothetical protein AAF721_17540, partial [Myxococcota bacterium]
MNERKRPRHEHWPMEHDGDFNLALIPSACVVAFTVFAITKWNAGDIGVAQQHAVLAFACLVGSVPALLEQYRDVQFRRWIIASWDDIVAGTAVLEGQTVDQYTELVGYRR